MFFHIDVFLESYQSQSDLNGGSPGGFRIICTHEDQSIAFGYPSMFADGDTECRVGGIHIPIGDHDDIPISHHPRGTSLSPQADRYISLCGPVGHYISFSPDKNTAHVFTESVTVGIHLYRSDPEHIEQGRTVFRDGYTGLLDFQKVDRGHDVDEVAGTPFSQTDLRSDSAATNAFSGSENTEDFEHIGVGESAARSGTYVAREEKYTHCLRITEVTDKYWSSWLNCFRCWNQYQINVLNISAYSFKKS